MVCHSFVQTIEGVTFPYMKWSTLNLFQRQKHYSEDVDETFFRRHSPVPNTNLKFQKQNTLKQPGIEQSRKPQKEQQN